MNNDPKKVAKKSFIRIGLSTGIFLVLLFLKLGQFGIVANWSWWWIASPLWVPITTYIIGALSVALIIRMVYKLRERKFRKQREESENNYRIER